MQKTPYSQPLPMTQKDDIPTATSSIPETPPIETQPTISPPPKKSKKLFIIGSILIIVIVIIGLMLSSLSSNLPKGERSFSNLLSLIYGPQKAVHLTPTPPPIPTLSPTPTPTSKVPPDWKTYINKTNEIQISYPQDWNIEESTFQNDKNMPIIDINKDISANNFSVLSIRKVNELNTQGVNPESLKEFKYKDWTGVRSTSKEGNIQLDAIAVLKTINNGTKFQASWIYLSSGENNFTTEKYFTQILSTFQFLN